MAKRVLKEVGKIILGFLAFLVVLSLLALLDNATDEWISGHNYTRALMNTIMVWSSCAFMRSILKARYVSILLMNTSVLVFAESLGNAYSFLLPVTMMAWLVYYHQIYYSEYMRMYEVTYEN